MSGRVSCAERGRRSGSAWRAQQLVGVALVVTGATIGLVSVRARTEVFGPILLIAMPVLAAALWFAWRAFGYVDVDDEGLRILRLGRQRFRWDEVAAFALAEAAMPQPNWQPSYLVNMHLRDGAVITLPAPRTGSASDEDFRAALSFLRSRLDRDPGQPPGRWPKVPFPPHR
jgi:hypothetical protein